MTFMKLIYKKENFRVNIGQSLEKKKKLIQVAKYPLQNTLMETCERLLSLMYVQIQILSVP